MDSYAILVVIISVLMIIVLALLVAVLVYAIKISKNIKNISVTANQTVEVAKTAALNLKNAAGPIATGKFVMDMVSKFQDSKTKKSKSAKK